MRRRQAETLAPRLDTGAGCGYSGWRSAPEAVLVAMERGEGPMAKRRLRDSVVVVTGASSGIGRATALAYVASKAAIRALSRCLRQELRDARHIHVCTVMPASHDTPIFQSGANYHGLAARPMPPIGDPFAVAAAIVRLARRPRPEVVVAP